MMSIFRYEVFFYDEFKDEERTEKGICTGENYGDAANKLVDTNKGYGDVISVKLWDLEDDIITDSDLEIDLRK